MNKNLEILKTMCLTWSDDQVYEAWNIIATEGKDRKNKAASRLKEDLAVGDTVAFEGRKAGTCTGVIVRVKRKKAIVNVSGRDWNVPLTMLKKI